MYSKFVISRNLRIIASGRLFSTSRSLKRRHCCKLLVVGGGTGGCTISARFAKKLCKNDIIVLEPRDIHFNQSMFTLIGGGLRKLRDSCKPMMQVLHPNLTWFQDAVELFCPQSNMVVTKNDEVIEYDFMVIALGIKNDYDKVCNLKEALDNYPNVTTIFSADYVEKTFKSFRQFVEGNALFTHPACSIKCPGASLKICFLAEHYFRKEDKRCEADISFVSACKCIFPVPKYCEALMKVADNRNIQALFRMNLVEVKPDDGTALFECVDNPGNKICLEYSLLHVAPPMCPPDELRNCTDIVDKDGFVDVHCDTLQHKMFPNIFSIGDCSGTKNSKTGSAIACQAPIIYDNLMACMSGQSPEAKYNGYSACPFLTSYGTGILAEFDYNYNPMETFPIRQDVESSFMYYLTKDILPELYWRRLITGNWNGPAKLRKIMHFKFRKLIH